MEEERERERENQRTGEVAGARGNEKNSNEDMAKQPPLRVDVS